MHTCFRFAPALLASLFAAAAQAHVTLENPLAPTGSSYRAVLRVGHGCSGSSTTALHVTVPPGFEAAQPLVKPGWVLATRVGPLAQPYTRHGVRYAEGVQEISWTAQGPEHALPDAWGDEFVLRGTTPQQPGTLWFKVVQHCEKGRIDWVEVPAEGQDAHALKASAARLDVGDAPAVSGHKH